MGSLELDSTYVVVLNALNVFLIASTLLSLTLKHV